MRRHQRSFPVRWWLLFASLSVLGRGCACGSVADHPVDEKDAATSDASDDGMALVDGEADGAAVSACDVAKKTGDPLGCTYLSFVPAMNDPPENAEGCVALFVSNPGDRPAELKLQWRGSAVDIVKHGRLMTPGVPVSYLPLGSTALAPRSSAILALFQGKSHPEILADTCPFPAAVAADIAARPEGRTNAFRLDSSEPVAVSQTIPFGLQDYSIGTGHSLRAESNWDRSYLDIGSFRPGRPDRYDGGLAEFDYWFSLPSEPFYTTITATRPVQVKIRREAGVVSYSVAANEVLSLVQDDGQIGQPIEANDVISVATGTDWLRVPFDAPFNPSGQISIHSMAPPSSWGNEVAAVRFPRRYPSIDEPGVWRILGAKSGTTLSYDPAPPPGAPTTIDQGEQVIFESPGPFVVRSQDAAHPFHLSLIMKTFSALCTGSGADCMKDVRGNAELAAVLPPNEYAHRFAFLTDPGYPQTHLVVVRRKDDTGFHDVTLDCAGKLGEWNPIGNEGIYQYTYAALSNGRAFSPVAYPNGSCTLGPHTLSSDGPTAVTLWGWGQSESDGESAGLNSYAITVFGLGPRPERPSLPQN